MALHFLSIGRRKILKKLPLINILEYTSYIPLNCFKILLHRAIGIACMFENRVPVLLNNILQNLYCYAINRVQKINRHQTEYYCRF